MISVTLMFWEFLVSDFSLHFRHGHSIRFYSKFALVSRLRLHFDSAMNAKGQKQKQKREVLATTTLNQRNYYYFRYFR